MPTDRRILALAIAAAALTALAGCGGDKEEPKAPAAQAVAPKPTPTKAAAPRLDPEKLKSAVEKSVLAAKDVGHDVKMQDQDQSLDVPTNDICAQEWESNSFRLARHQDFFWEDAEVADLVVSTEVVAYEPGKAKAALAEIESAVADCDKWEHEQGEMASVSSVDPPEGALADAFSWKGVDERKDGKYAYLATYQLRGDLLSAVYVWADDSSDAKEISTELAAKAAKRLEAAAG